MPYINRQSREVWDSVISDNKINSAFQGPGDLNYILTTLAIRYLNVHGMNYENFNAVMGALECVKQEIYRRIAAPYENIKILQNGDVPELANLCDALIYEQEEAFLAQRYQEQQKDEEPTDGSERQ